MGKKERLKGHNFERYIARIFREIYPSSKRHLEYQSDEAEEGVDVCAGPFIIQCKRKKKYSAISALYEINDKESKISVLATKGDRTEPVIVLSLKNFMRIIKGELND